MIGVGNGFPGIHGWRQHPGPGVVYAQTRAATEKLAETLGRGGRAVRAYHAGMDPATRAANQAAFIASETLRMYAGEL